MFKASDIQGVVFDQPKFVIEDLVVEGVTLLAGSPKVGKSWMMLNMGVGVAMGGEFLGKECMEQNVLCLALEDNGRRLQNRLRKVCAWDPFPNNLCFETEWSRFPAGLKPLEALIVANAFKFVIIDTLEMVRPPRRSNSYEDDYRALGGLRDMAQRLHVAFLVIHHNRKGGSTLGGEELDPLEMVSGTMGLTGSVDSVLVLSRTRGMNYGELYAMGRDIPESRVTVQLDSEMGIWQVYEKSTKGY